MAKKKIKTTNEDIVVNEEVVERPVVKPQTPTWEIKDRVYYLARNRSPLTFTPRLRGLLYFDEEKGYEREVGYAPNQPTPFVDEWKGKSRREHIIFRNGVLSVPKSKTTLQKFLSIYHPKANASWYEVNNEKQATYEVDNIELELAAMNLAKSLNIEELEAIMRVQAGSNVSNLSTKELKRDALVLARTNPALFINIAKDDNVHLRNVGIKANEQDIIYLSPDQRYFSWKSNNRKLMTVPFDEHPYTALAHWFKTDEGMEVYTNIEKRLS